MATNLGVVRSESIRKERSGFFARSQAASKQSSNSVRHSSIWIVRQDLSRYAAPVASGFAQVDERVRVPGSIAVKQREDVERREGPRGIERPLESRIYSLRAACRRGTKAGCGPAWRNQYFEFVVSLSRRCMIACQ